ncbi:MAG: GtrA family protein [Candidatus Caccovivens sp.]
MKNSSLLQAIKFTLFSISAGLIQIASFELLYDLININYWVSYLTSLILSVLWNFTFNRKFTFKSANNVPFAMFLVFLYYLVFTPLSTLWGNAMENAGIEGILVTAFSMIVNFVTEFLYQKFVVFRGSIDSAVNRDEENFKKIIKILKTDF